MSISVLILESKLTHRGSGDNYRTGVSVRASDALGIGLQQRVEYVALAASSWPGEECLHLMFG